MIRYGFTEFVPLNFVLMRNAAPVTGLTVTVQVINSLTGAVLLSSISCPETNPGVSGLYTYQWMPGISSFTQCMVIFTRSGGKQYRDEFLIGELGSGSGSGSGSNDCKIVAILSDNVIAVNFKTHKIAASLESEELVARTGNDTLSVQFKSHSLQADLKTDQLIANAKDQESVNIQLKEDQIAAELKDNDAIVAVPKC